MHKQLSNNSPVASHSGTQRQMLFGLLALKTHPPLCRCKGWMVSSNLLRTTSLQPWSGTQKHCQIHRATRQYTALSGTHSIVPMVTSSVQQVASCVVRVECYLWSTIYGHRACDFTTRTVLVCVQWASVELSVPSQCHGMLQTIAWYTDTNYAKQHAHAGMQRSEINTPEQAPSASLFGRLTMALGYHPPHYLQSNDSQSAHDNCKKYAVIHLDKVRFHQTPKNIDYTLDYVPISQGRYQYIRMCGCNIQILCDT